MLHCDVTGEEKIVRTDELLKALPNLDSSITFNEKVEYVAGMSEKGSFKLSAKSRCPKCNSDDYRLPDGDHVDLSESGIRRATFSEFGAPMRPRPRTHKRDFHLLRTVIQALKTRELVMAQHRYDLTDAKWNIIEPLLPNKSRGVKRVDDRRVLNGIFWRMRAGAPWADIPERYGPHTTCYNRFVRWRKAGVWARLLCAISEAYDGRVQMIDSTSVRVHQHGANGDKKGGSAIAWAVPAAGIRPKSMPSSTATACRSH